MQLFWRGSWIAVPGYETPDPAVLVEVHAAVPITRLENPSGRAARQPLRKAVIFLVTDGPRSTLRKIRAKRQEQLFTGDFHITVLFGRAVTSQIAVVALACRVPPAAQQIPVHRDLTRELSDECTAEEMERIASFLMPQQSMLSELGRQNFLWSEMSPPTKLVKYLHEAVDHRLTPASTANAELPEPIRPPEGTGEAADTVLSLKPSRRRAAAMPVALLGAGDYARTEIIPALRRAGLSLYSVSNREPQIAALTARDHAFALATTDSERAIAELPEAGLVVVATAHDSHARLASAAAEAGHRVFLEKPAAVTEDDVRLLARTMSAYPGAVEIGFNRRYHPLILSARSQLERESGPLSVVCTIKELALEPDHWYLWPNQGTRITGNLCHWIDLAVFLMNERAMPVSLTISPRVSESAHSIDEERMLVVTFEDESMLSIFATSRGDDIRGVQEQIEIRKGRTTIAIDDLWKMRVRRDGRDRRSRTLFRRKGHTDMYRAALRRVLRREAAVYPLRDMVMVAAIQIAASDLARSDELAGEVPSWASSLAAETTKGFM